MTQRSMAEIIRRQNPAMLPATATVREACSLMRDRRIGAVLVTGSDGGLVGLFTGRDVVGRVVAEALDANATPLAVVMTPKPDTLGPAAGSIEALRRMQDGGFRHMPILDGAKIVGIVSFADFNGMERARLDDETGFWEIL
jgi:CBS domain-containing protein